MTIQSIFIMVLNLTYCVIIPWFLYYAYRQYKANRSAAGQIRVYDPARLNPHKLLLVVTLLYVSTIVVLWLLYMFKVSHVIEDHWFSYVFMLVLPVVANHDRVLMYIGEYGISQEGNVIPWEFISYYEFGKLNTVTNRLLLEIHTKDNVIRGLLPSESQEEIRQFLEENKVQSKPA